MKTKLALFVSISLCIMSISAAWAQNPIKSIKYQKTTALSSGVYTMKFSLYLDFRSLPLKAFIAMENSVTHRISQAESMRPNLVSNCI